MKDAGSLTVVELKEKLKTLKQNTTRTKAELIRRLMAADPSGSWMDDMSCNGAAVGEDVVDDADDVGVGRSDQLRWIRSKVRT